MLDLRLLRSFVTIADTGNFTHAAHRLHMTQSTISQQLSRLESTLGQTLLDRGARPVAPTPSGQRLLGYARRMLALQDEAERLLGDPGSPGFIRIGVPEDHTSMAIAEAFVEFMAQHPGLRLDVTGGLSRELGERYRRGELDIVVVKEAAPGSDCLAHWPEPLGWVESPAHPAMALEPLPLVTFPNGGLYREQMFELLEARQRRWYVAFTGSSLDSVLAATRAGLGISLLPLSITRPLPLRAVDALPPPPPMVVSLYAWEKEGPAAELAARLGALLQARAGMPQP